MLTTAMTPAPWPDDGSSNMWKSRAADRWKDDSDSAFSPADFLMPSSSCPPS